MVGPPDNGNLTTQTLWKEGRLVRFVDDGDGAISLPPVSISTLLDAPPTCGCLTSAHRREARAMMNLPPGL